VKSWLEFAKMNVLMINKGHIYNFFDISGFGLNMQKKMLHLNLAFIAHGNDICNLTTIYVDG
jgi:hypothetical protein